LVIDLVSFNHIGIYTGSGAVLGLVIGVVLLIVYSLPVVLSSLVAIGCLLSGFAIGLFS
jgi:hypothetical protein